MNEIKDENVFVFNQFNSNNSIYIKDTIPIPLSNFELFYSKVKPITISKKAYLKECNNLISSISNGPLKKVVLSRVKEVQNNASPINIFNKLNELSKNTFNYIISIENVGIWIGATPEILVKIENESVQTTSLAGTKPLNKIDWTQKEKEEQEFVTDYINEVLSKHSNSEIQQNGPFTHKTSIVAHLKTDFRTKIDSKEWKNLVSDLHPTPAISGLPKNSSINLINKIETHDRKFYTGFIGLVSSKRKNLFVNLRCMEVFKDSVFLYVGGGITKDSNENDEWDETELKSETLLQAIK